MDPGWFYSSLAQSAAAIVGLAGGILGARILQHLQHTRERRAALMARVQDLQVHLTQMGPHLVEFEAFLHEEMELDEATIQQGSRIRPGTTMRGSGPLSMNWAWKDTMAPHTVEALSDKQMADKKLGELKLVVPAYSSFSLSGRIDAAALRRDSAELRSAAGTVSEEPADVLRRDAQALAELADRLCEYQATILPMSFFLVLALLIALGLFCIIWPLALLPGFPGSQYARGLMLIALTVGVLGLLGYIGFQMVEIRVLGNVQWLSERELRALPPPRWRVGA